MEKLSINARIWFDPFFQWEIYGSWIRISPCPNDYLSFEKSLKIRDFRENTNRMASEVNFQLRQYVHTSHYRKALAKARADMAAVISQPAYVIADISETKNEKCICSVELLPPREENNLYALFSLTTWSRPETRMDFLITKEDSHWCWQIFAGRAGKIPNITLVLLAQTSRQKTITIESLEHEQKKETIISDKIVEKTKLLTR